MGGFDSNVTAATGQLKSFEVGVGMSKVGKPTSLLSLIKVTFKKFGGQTTIKIDTTRVLHDVAVFPAAGNYNLRT